MTISSNNDWDPLEEVIVGRADTALMPPIERSTHSFCYGGNSWNEIKDIPAKHHKAVIEEATEDIELLIDTLKKLKIKVYRPSPIDQNKKFSTPEWTTRGWYQWCPRDLLLPLDNLIIETPSPMRARYFETRAYYPYLYDQMKQGSEWICAPKPILDDDSYQFDIKENPTLLNKEIIFDAPNVVRLGRDILAQVSNSGNQLGFQWLKTILEPRGYRIHLAEKYYSFSHFDSTILPLRPGLVLFNSDRVKPNRYPPMFKKWDKIWFGGDLLKTRPVDIPGNIGLCSTAIGLNFLSVNEKLVICDEIQVELRKVLSNWGIDTIGLPMRHAQNISGGFHCVTLDVKRKGKLENYFD